MNTNKHSDKKLIKSYLAGEQQALALLVERWHLIFCKKAYWIVKDADLSKDVAQESWSTIIAQLHTLQNPSSFKSWALRIVFTKAMDAFRKQSRERLELNALKNKPNSTAEVNDDRTQLKEMLLKAIKTLPEQQQLVVRLFYNENYSLREMSAMLDISVGTVKSRLFHAREALKLILKHKHYK
ncbi:RNA polymerase sigma factor [Psychroserpens algicola]|uniref:RNA polymerase sigma factor n=1 Tax=Psychroserpens algicola TaxID=1719034 RepID=A0ABT0H693_9FLAO|nr:RNA polymerase sigma factor [Psychroserpens algicola]MCK8479888.1 RNA polymerase sigma factor [Psychroserpens algicola]